jgi:hypothetical protein
VVKEKLMIATDTRAKMSEKEKEATNVKARLSFA